jgi:hypothetical protein
MKNQRDLTKTNELFGLFKKKNVENDKLAKETFFDMLEHIKELDVRVVGDSKREVVFGGKKKTEEENSSKQKEQEHSEVEKEVENETEKEASEKETKPGKEMTEKEFSVSQKEMKESSKVYNFSEFVQEKLKDYGIPQKQVVKNVRRFETEYTKTGKTFVSVMKTHSDHRFSSKFFGATKENSYSLAINGEHLISKVKGEEGKPLVSPKITELYWNFLTELGQLQIRRKRNIIKTNDDYDRLVDDLKSKYGNLLNKLK